MDVVNFYTILQLLVAITVILKCSYELTLWGVFLIIGMWKRGEQVNMNELTWLFVKNLTEILAYLSVTLVSIVFAHFVSMKVAVFLWNHYGHGREFGRDHQPHQQQHQQHQQYPTEMRPPLSMLIPHLSQNFDTPPTPSSEMNMSSGYKSKSSQSLPLHSINEEIHNLRKASSQSFDRESENGSLKTSSTYVLGRSRTFNDILYTNGTESVQGVQRKSRLSMKR